MCTLEVVAAGKQVVPRHMREEWWIEDGQSKDLVALLAEKDQATWDQVAVKVLNMVRCREFIEYNPKTDLVVPTRFCQYNIAFFDLDKESVVVPRPPISKIPASKFWCLEDSVNVISIKVTESDVGYPIYVYGTILARDQYDYRCIYLFKRGTDNPQLIMSPDDMLTLAGPFRAFAVTGSMFFEFHLKIKRVGLVDQNLSKCLLEHNTSRHTCQPMTVSLKSCLSTIVMVYSPVSSGVEASVEINILNGPSSFTGKVTACTTESQGRMILYDSEVAGTRKELGTGGSVALTRRIVAGGDAALRKHRGRPHRSLRVSKITRFNADLACLELAFYILEKARILELLSPDPAWTGHLDSSQLAELCKQNPRWAVQIRLAREAIIKHITPVVTPESGVKLEIL